MVTPPLPLVMLLPELDNETPIWPDPVPVELFSPVILISTLAAVIDPELNWMPISPKPVFSMALWSRRSLFCANYS